MVEHAPARSDDRDLGRAVSDCVSSGGASANAISRRTDGNDAPPPRSSKRAVAAIVFLWIVVMVAVSVVAGCYGHNCDGDVLVFGREPGEGRLVDPNTWESNRVDQTWVPFTKQRAIVFDLPEFTDRTPDLIVPYIAADPDPLAAGSSFTIASGNIAEISGARPGTFTIRNGTCADYYIRVVVTTSPPSSSASPVDGGAEPSDGGDAAADASPNDAASGDAEGGM